MKTISLKAFQDNEIWLIHQDKKVIVVDPGDAKPVLSYLNSHGFSLDAILITHHHQDHTGGISELLAHYPAQVFAPKEEAVTGCTHPLTGGETLSFFDTPCRVIKTQGHTRAHLSYLLSDALFCGDALFAGGCRRVFEGTMAEMFASLQAICALPDDTKIYCAHEYTQANLRFARAVEPSNLSLKAREASVVNMRAQGISTLPSLLSLEKATNPFLRVQMPEVIKSAQARDPKAQTPLEVFSALRAWKNVF